MAAETHIRHKNPKCDVCEMSHPKDGCPPLRKWWVNLVTQKGRSQSLQAVGTVEARAAWTAMALAVERFGDRITGNHERISIDDHVYIRTAWDRILDDDLWN